MLLAQFALENLTGTVGPFYPGNGATGAIGSVVACAIP